MNNQFSYLLPIEFLTEKLKQNGFIIDLETQYNIQKIISPVFVYEQQEYLAEILCPIIAKNANEQVVFHRVFNEFFVKFKKQETNKVDEIQNKGEHITDYKKTKPEKTPDEQKSRFDDYKNLLNKDLKSKAKQQIKRKTNRSGEISELVANRKHGTKPPYNWNIFIDKQELELDENIHKVSSQMRYKEETETLIIDIEQTIKETIENFGIIKPVFKLMSKHVEYLMLIDRSNDKNHQAQVYEQIYNVFKSSNIYIERFFFSNDPRLCVNENYLSGVTLLQIFQRHPESFLLFFSSAESLIYIRKFEPYKWTETLKEWKRRILFTPEPESEWGKREEILNTLFPVIFPGTTNGIVQLSKYFNEILQSELINLEFWKDRTNFETNEIEIDDEIDFLEFYYRPELLTWIAACAVYPDMSWNLTLYLGKLLSTQQENLNTQENLVQLNRLKWFRDGKIPDEQRIKLIKKTEWLPKDIELNIRQAIIDLMLKSPKPDNFEESYAYNSFLTNLVINEILVNPKKENIEKLARDLESLINENLTQDFVSIVHALENLDILDFKLSSDIADYLREKLGIEIKTSSDTITDNKIIREINTIFTDPDLKFIEIDISEIMQANEIKCLYYAMDENEKIIGLCINHFDFDSALNHIFRKSEDWEYLTHLNLYDNKIKDISSLQVLHNLKELNLDFNEISDLSPLTSLRQIISLSLFSNSITDISTIDYFKQILDLNLSNNKIQNFSLLGNLLSLEFLNLDSTNFQQISILKNLKNLSTLILNNNQISDISDLTQLKNITKLVLNNNQISDISSIGELFKISELFLSDNQINDISALQNLTKLQVLELSGNKVNNLSAIQELKSITKLYLSDNEIENISALHNLHNLNFLYIVNNQISDISFLQDLQNLNYLFLSNNRIFNISVLRNLYKLTNLYVSFNQLTDISALQNLTNLINLHIQSNYISDIAPLKNFKKLLKLDLRFNPINYIPEWITDFPNMDIVWSNQFIETNSILLFKNPIENIPIEVVQLGKQAIKSWFTANKKKLNEIKIFLVGDASVGKTAICKRLKDNTFDKHEKQTDGIKIEKLVFADLPTFSKQTRLHGLSAYVWDFGGQEIMTSTFRFFLTNRSIYIFVLEARNDISTESHIRKWLENIITQGGNSRVLIVVNKIDINPAFDIDLYNLRKEFPQIEGYVRISCEKNENLDMLKQLLETTIPKAELFNTEIDERWLKIKVELQVKTEQKRKLNESEFLEVCTKHNLFNPFEQAQCIRFLHDLGVILHFDSLDLGEYYILDPLWVTTGIYRIITSEKVAKASGIIFYEDLREIVNTTLNENGEYSEITYSNSESRYLADIMEEFRLCFFASQKRLMLIPDLFKKETPVVEVERIIYSAEKLELIYDYQFLHPSVISRLIVAINGEIQHFWRSGVITASKLLNATCLVRAINDQIQITLIGDRKDNRQYLSQIRYFINQINEEFKLKPKLLIPLSENSFIEYEMLLEFEREGERTYRDFKSKKTYQISQLLESIESNEEIQRQSGTIVNNYNTINVTGMNNKVIQDAVKSKISLIEDSGLKTTDENKGLIQNLELLIDKKIFLEKELILTYESEKKFAIQTQIKELETQILELKLSNNSIKNETNNSENTNKTQLINFKLELHNIIDKKGFSGVPEILKKIEKCEFNFNKSMLANIRNDSISQLSALMPDTFLIRLRRFIDMLE